MKGLLLKDFYLTKKYLRSLVIISVVFLIVSVVAPENDFFRVYPCIMAAMLPVSLFSYDDREKWTIYAQAFPVSRAQYVTEKYLFGAFSFAAYLALLALTYLIVGTEGLGDAVAIALLFGLLMPAIMLPLLFRLGAEKGRIAYIVFAGVIGSGFAFTYIAKRPTSGSEAFPVPNWALCVIPIVLYVLSWRLSVRLYNKREL